MQVMAQTVLEYGERSLEFIPLFAKLPMADKQKAEQPCVPKWLYSNTPVPPLLWLGATSMQTEMIWNAFTYENLPAQVNKNIWTEFSHEEKLLWKTLRQIIRW